MANSAEDVSHCSGATFQGPSDDVQGNHQSPDFISLANLVIASKKRQESYADTKVTNPPVDEKENQPPTVKPASVTIPTPEKISEEKAKKAIDDLTMILHLALAPRNAKDKAQMPTFCKVYKECPMTEKPEPDYSEVEHIETFLLAALHFSKQNEKSAQKFFNVVWKRIASGEYEQDICHEVKCAWPSQGLAFHYAMSNFLIAQIRKFVAKVIYFFRNKFLFSFFNFYLPILRMAVSLYKPYHQIIGSFFNFCLPILRMVVSLYKPYHQIIGSFFLLKKN